MKRIIPIYICFILCLFTLVGCDKVKLGDYITSTESKATESNIATATVEVTEPQTEATSKEKPTVAITEPQTEPITKEEDTVIATEPQADEITKAEELKKEYEYYKSSFYELPKAEELINTSWFNYDIFDDGRETHYNIEICEDVINITWNDGIDFEDHHYTAPWSLKTENDVCIMELDLGNLDGIRNYCILVTTDNNLIYFSQDFVNDDIRDYEIGSRVLERSFG